MPCAPRRQARVEVVYDDYLPDDDRPSRRRLSPTTLMSARRAWSRWLDFCTEFNLNPTARLTIQRVKRFIHWYINYSGVRALGAAFVALRHWRLAYVMKTNCTIDDALKSEMQNYIRTDICLEFELPQRGQDKKVMNVDDLLAILHVLALAFADDAFKSRWLKKPADLFCFEVTDERGLQAIPLEWRDDKLDVSLLKGGCGKPGKGSSTEAWSYDDARNGVVRLGKAVGLKDPLSLYSGRRGFGEAIDKHASSAVRNRAMGHSRSEIFERFYTNQVVPVDTVSAFLGTASEDWTIKIATHMSITRDPHAQKYVAEPTMAAVKADPEVAKLDAASAKSKSAVLQRFRSIRAATGSAEELQYRRAAVELRSAIRRTKRRLYEDNWRAWFANLGATEIERQRTAQDLLAAPRPTEFGLEERRDLATLLCRNDDVSRQPFKEVHDRRVRALDAMMSLCGRRLRPQVLSRRLKTPPDESVDVGECSGEELYGPLQCPWCFYDDDLPPTHQRFRYAQLKSLRHHIEMKHMSLQPASTVNPLDITLSLPLFCPISSCSTQVERDEHMRNHLATQHGFFCTTNVSSEFVDAPLISEGYSDDAGWLDMVDL